MVLYTLWVEAISFSEWKMKTAMTLKVRNLVLLLMLTEINRTLLVKQCQYIVYMYSNMNFITVKLLSCLTLLLTILNRMSIWVIQTLALHVSSPSECRAVHNTGWTAEFSWSHIPCSAADWKSIHMWPTTQCPQNGERWCWGQTRLCYHNQRWNCENHYESISWSQVIEWFLNYKTR